VKAEIISGIFTKKLARFHNFAHRVDRLMGA